jgi:hypothetical protein
MQNDKRSLGGLYHTQPRDGTNGVDDICRRSAKRNLEELLYNQFESEEYWFGVVGHGIAWGSYSTHC